MIAKNEMNQSQTTCPFLSNRFIPEKRIERICSEALTSAGLMPSKAEPIRIDRFVDRHFKVTIDYDDLEHRFGEGVMGACRFNRDGKVEEILINRSLGDDQSQIGNRRHRSTLAHEVGHGLLHGELFAEKLKHDEEARANGWIDTDYHDSVFSEGFACREFSGSKGVWWEVQANMAMAALLLPWQLVIPFLRDNMTPSKRYWEGIPIYDLTSACGRIADAFDVSVTMARYRIKKEYEQLKAQRELF